MPAAPPDDLSRFGIARQQSERLAVLLAHVAGHNPFYQTKYHGIDTSVIRSAADLARLPFTTKAELLADQAAHPPYGSIHSEPPENYVRLHQTSGTSGTPLRWLDTAESWEWILGCWTTKFRMAGLRRNDRLFFPFSFGPFLGFWAAFEAAARLGNLCLPGGGMNSTARLRFLLDNRATVVLCTPTYALHLAEVAARERIDLPASPVRMVIVAGEPGGSIPATRARIEAGWGARVFDHNGMTETGPVGFECVEAPNGLHLLETEYVAEVVEPATGKPVPVGTVGELVLTNLGRLGSPLIRYRTGDLVRVDPTPCVCGRALVRLDGGILGRVDDMLIVRGNNLHPSALQTLLHRFAEVAEYRVELDQTQALAVLRVEVEPRPDADAPALVARVDRAIRDELLFRAEVRAVSPGSLPRPEHKAQRLVRKTSAGTAPTAEKS